MQRALAAKRAYINHSYRTFGVPYMEFSKKEMFYMSNPSDCEWRNELLRSLNVSHICDAYACVGGDAVQFIVIKPEAMIDCVQVVDSEETHERCMRLQRNVSGFASAQQRIRVRVYASTIRQFILSGACSSVDFLYCDPPWAPPENARQLLSCDGILETLRQDVAIPLKNSRAKPRYICFKVPHDWQHFSRVLQLFPEYSHVDSGAFSRDRYWFHLIQY